MTRPSSAPAPAPAIAIAIAIALALALTLLAVAVVNACGGRRNRDFRHIVENEELKHIHVIKVNPNKKPLASPFLSLAPLSLSRPCPGPHSSPPLTPLLPVCTVLQFRDVTAPLYEMHPDGPGNKDCTRYCHCHLPPRPDQTETLSQRATHVTLPRLTL